MKKRNNKPINFLNLLEEKGIISSSKKSKKHSENRPMTLGGIFSEIIKDLTTDPELREKQYNLGNEESFDDFDSYYEDDFDDDIINHAEEQRKQEVKRAHREEAEIRRKEAREKAKKNIEEARKFEEKKQRLEKDRKEIDNQLYRITKIRHILKDKNSLRQAFILNEVLSKPLGLK